MIAAADILYIIFPYLTASEFLRLTSSTVRPAHYQSHAQLITQFLRKHSPLTVKTLRSGVPSQEQLSESHPNPSCKQMVPDGNGSIRT